jgi:hypothetical protein
MDPRWRGAARANLKRPLKDKLRRWPVLVVEISDQDLPAESTHLERR